MSDCGGRAHEDQTSGGMSPTEHFPVETRVCGLRCVRGVWLCFGGGLIITGKGETMVFGKMPSPELCRPGGEGIHLQATGSPASFLDRV